MPDYMDDNCFIQEINDPITGHEYAIYYKRCFLTFRDTLKEAQDYYNQFVSELGK